MANLLKQLTALLGGKTLPNSVIFIGFAVATVVIIILVVVAIVSANKAKTLALESEDKAKKAEELSKQIETLKNAQTKSHPLSSQASEPRDENSSVIEQNKDLIFMTKEYLVSDFMDSVRRYFPQEFNLRARETLVPGPVEQRLDQLLIQLKKIEELSPEHQFNFPIEYYYQKIYFYQARGNLHDLLHTVHHCLEMFGFEERLYLYTIRLLFLFSHYHECIKFSEKFLTQKPAQLEVLGTLVKCFFNIHDLKKAEEECRKLVELKQDSRAFLALILHLEGYVSRSEEISDDILKSGFENPEILLRLGMLDELRGQTKEALQKYVKAWNIGGRDYELLRHLVHLNALFAGFGMNKKILEEIKSNIDIDTDIVFMALNDTQLSVNTRKSLQELLLRRCAQRSIDLKALNNAGLLKLKADQPQEAEHYFSQALKVHEASLESLCNMAKLHLRAHQPDKAREFVDKGLGFYPHNSDLLLLLSEIHIQKNEHEDARGLILKAGEREPENLDIQLKIGHTWLKENNFKEALACFTKIEDAKVRNIDVFRSVAFIYYRMEAWEDAVHYYHKVLDLDSNNLDAWNNLGVISSLRHEYKRARRYFNQALRIDPESKETNYNIAMLYRKITQEGSVKHFAKYKELIEKSGAHG